MDFKQKLQQIVQNTGARHLGHAIKRDPDLLVWIKQQTQTWPTLNLSQRVRCILYDESPQCDRSLKLRSWKSIQLGFGFCARAADCECAAESVSRSVMISKTSISDQQQSEINQKRLHTNIAKYGVGNSGQTAQAKQAHAQVYSDPSRVQQIVHKGQQTMVERYGVSNPMKLDTVKQKSVATCMAKYGVSNINHLDRRKQEIGITSQHTWIKRKADNLDYNRLCNKFETQHNIKFVTSAENYKGTVGSNYYEFQCMVCDHNFDDYVYCGHIPRCRMCNPPPPAVWCSQEENDLAAYVESLGVSVDRSNRSLINPFELDIVIHSHKLAIEYCGLYWHAQISNGKQKDYHKNKMELCAARGYQLITIFSDEWCLKRSIVESKLAHILGANLNQKLGARLCEIVEVQGTDARSFLETNHIQGWAPRAIVHLGLKYKNNIVSLMSMSELRQLTNNQSQDGSFELLRYASSAQVQGGASRLLREFEKRYRPQRLISFADARWSMGNLYHNLGFEFVHTSAPGYWYTRDYQTREHRARHTKGGLVKQGFDSAHTEWEIQMSRGYDRIWDCGQLKFEKLYSTCRAVK
jgi:hypothetical protein